MFIVKRRRYADAGPGVRGGLRPWEAPAAARRAFASNEAQR
ncbi:MAG TPA: hypothetical protein VGG50_15110 [Streptosporangiaceae bacterium]